MPDPRYIVVAYYPGSGAQLRLMTERLEVAQHEARLWSESQPGSRFAVYELVGVEEGGLPARRSSPAT